MFHSEENFNASVHSSGVMLSSAPYRRKMSARSACFVILSKDHRENERVAQLTDRKVVFNEGKTDTEEGGRSDRNFRPDSSARVTPYYR